MEKGILPESVECVDKTITIPKKLCEKVEEAICGHEITFGELVATAIMFLFEYLDVEESEK